MNAQHPVGTLVFIVCMSSCASSGAGPYSFLPANTKRSSTCWDCLSELTILIETMRHVQLHNETCMNGSLLRLWCGSHSAVCVFTADQRVDTHLNNSTPTSDIRSEKNYTPWIGLTLALLSAVLIGSSVILKKKALLRLLNKGGTRAGDGGHGYLKDWMWWSGLLTMGSGEVCNFVAYMFAPATLVTPLGALSVLISAVLSSCLLGELLNVVGKLGCLLCILGSILLVIHAPQEQEVTSLEEMTEMLLQPGFLTCMVVVLVACAVLVLFICPRFGRTNVLVYISVCSLLGAFSVSSVKGLAIVLHQVFFDKSVLTEPLTWILLLTLIVSVVTQVNYLNKSLDSFSTLLVYPIYYVLFTSVVLLTSIILFQEWHNMSAVDVATMLSAFLVIVVGVAMLHLLRDLQITVTQLGSKLAQPVEERVSAKLSISEGEERTRRKEDRYRLMAMESPSPSREEGPRVFIIS